MNNKVYVIPDELLNEQTDTLVGLAKGLFGGAKAKSESQIDINSYKPDTIVTVDGKKYKLGSSVGWYEDGSKKPPQSANLVYANKQLLADIRKAAESSRKTSTSSTTPAPAAAPSAQPATPPATTPSPTTPTSGNKIPEGTEVEINNKTYRLGKSGWYDASKTGSNSRGISIKSIKQNRNLLNKINQAAQQKIKGQQQTQSQQTQPTTPTAPVTTSAPAAPTGPQTAASTTALPNPPYTFKSKFYSKNKDGDWYELGLKGVTQEESIKQIKSDQQLVDKLNELERKRQQSNNNPATNNNTSPPTPSQTSSSPTNSNQATQTSTSSPNSSTSVQTPAVTQTTKQGQGQQKQDQQRPQNNTNKPSNKKQQPIRKIKSRLSSKEKRDLREELISESLIERWQMLAGIIKS